MSVELLVSDIYSLLKKIGNHESGYRLREEGDWNSLGTASVFLASGELDLYSYSLSLMRLEDGFAVVARYVKDFVYVKIASDAASLGVIVFQGKPLDEHVVKRFTNPIDLPGKVPLVDNSPFVLTESENVDRHEKWIKLEDALFIFEGVKKDLEETLRLLETKGFVYSLPYEFYVHRPVVSRPAVSRPVVEQDEESSDYEEPLLGIEEVKLMIAVKSRIRIAKFKLYDLKPKAESYLRKTFICRTDEFNLYVIW